VSPRQNEPLPLTSPRWADLKAHFGNSATDGDDIAAVTTLITRWNDAISGYAEEYAYDPLHESFLHQGTILDVAYAVVPHLVVQLPRLDPDRCLEIVDDLALVENVRLTPRSEVERRVAQMATMPEGLRDLFMQNTRDRHPELADDLAPAYLHAIAVAKRLAGEQWGKESSRPMGPHRWRRHVRFLRECELTDGDIRFGVETLTHAPDGDSALVYLGLEDAERGLREAGDVEWNERVRLGTERGHLVLRALFALAWIERHAPIAQMLAR